MPVKAPVYKAAAPVDPWTGFYVGVNAGYGWGQGDVLVSPGPAGFGLAPFTTHPNPKGFIGGGQVGYNLRSGSFVYGVEADFSGANINGSVTDPTPGQLLGPAGSFQQVNVKLDWFGTLRGRVGFTPINNLLVYATGGLAVGHYSYSSLESYPLVIYPSAASATKAGWTVGGGAEWALPGNWSVKSEYLHFDLGSQTLVALPIPVFPPFSVSSQFKNSGDLVRVGLNYRFGGL
jgi:outer membrane immunogenic protein